MEQLYQCPTCQELIPHGTRYCHNCGNELSWQPQGPIPYYQQPQYGQGTPHYETTQQPRSVVGSGIVCIHCGRSVVTEKGKFDWGWFILWGLLGGVPGIIYLIYHASKRADRCPACGKNAYR
jgi:hypothetical protein